MSVEADIIWTETDEAARRDFERLVIDCESTSLARLALQVAVSEYPELPIETLIEKLETIADDVRGGLPEDASDGDKIRALNSQLFELLGFHGEDDAYFDPRSCYLNDVLTRGGGLPISLCILYLDVAGRLELSMVGVGLPGHFIVRYVGSGTSDELFVDPYNAGDILTRDECVAMVRRLTGGRLPWHDDYLRAVDHRHIITRLLNNLKGAYARLRDTRRSLRIQNYLLTLHPEAAHEFRDRGLLQIRLQSYRGAAEDLRTYLRLAPAALDRDVILDELVEVEVKIQSMC